MAEQEAVIVDRVHGRPAPISMALLEAAGYARTRTGASFGVFDIVGIGPSDVVLVQTKSNDWPGS